MHTDSVHFSCPHCRQPMAVAAEDLGHDVHCPHCEQVVPAPPAPEAAEPEAPTAAHDPEDITQILAPGAAPSAPPVPAAPAPEPEEEAPAPEPVVKARAPRPSRLGPLVVIFLVPYAIVVTAALVYVVFLYREQQAIDPLERMTDPNPKDGGPLRVPHDRPLPEKLQTGLGQPIRVGDVEVTPLAVERDQDDLVLRLRLRNLTEDVAFNPLPASFSHFLRLRRPPVWPYTYLQVGDKRVYGGDTEWRQGPPDKEERRADGNLAPGGEMIGLLRTDFRDRELVKKVDEVGGPLLWRVHVRRGFVEARGQEVSATAVVGVRFTREEIQPEKAGKPL